MTAVVIGTEDDDTSASHSVAIGTINKAIYAINGVFPPPPGFTLAPGDEVTYSLTYTMPYTSFLDFTLQDFLPLPAFLVGDPLADGSMTAWTFNVEPAGPARATPPASGVVELGPTDTFYDYRTVVPPLTNVSNPPTFYSPPQISINANSNSLLLYYGSFNDPDNQPTTINLLFTVTITDQIFADGLLLTNLGRGIEANSELDFSTIDSIAQIQIGQPELNITKGVVATNHPAPPAAFNSTPPVAAPLTITAPGTAGYRFSGTVNSNYLSAMPRPLDSNLANVDAGDLVTFVIIVENTGSSRTGAFDVQLRDTLPAGFVIPGGVPGLNLSVTDGTGAAIAFVDLGGGIFGAGIELTDPGPTPALPDGTNGGALDQYNATSGRNVLVVTYDLLVDTSAVPLDTITNTATLQRYAGQEGGTNHVAPIDEPSDDAEVTILSPSIDKVITATNQPHTAGNNVTIGEIVTYTATITVPEGTMPNAELIDTLDAGLAFVDIVSIMASVGVSTDVPGGFPAVAAGAVFSSVGGGPTAPGRRVTLDFGTITNANTNNAIVETIAVVYRVVVLNSTNNNRGSNRNNDADWQWDTATGMQTVSDSAPNVTIVEPTLQVVKSAFPASGEAGDVITFTINVLHTGASNTGAFDVSLEDIIPADFTYVGGSLMNTAGLAPTTLMELGGTITATWASFPLASTSQIQFQATIDVTAVAGSTITNVAAIEYTSLPGNVTVPQSPYNGLSVERTGDPTDPGGVANDCNASDPADVFIVNPVALAKLIVQTSEPSTAGSDVAIGEIVRYRLQVVMPQATIGPATQLVDTLPLGFTLLDLGEVRISFTTDTPMTLPADLVPANNSAVPPTFVLPAGRITQVGQLVFFTLGTITNNDMDANQEFATIEFNALVQNVAANNDGDVKGNFFQVYVAGAPVSASPTVNATIREPSITDVVKQLISPPPIDAGDTVTYQVTFSNTGSTTAFDTRLLDNLNVGDFTGVTVDSIVLGGGASGAVDNSAGNTIDIRINTIPVGGTVTVQYSAVLTIGVEPSETITNTANVTYTSLPGTGTPVGPNNQTGSVTLGASGAANGERNGSGGVNDYFDSDSESVLIASPMFAKTLTATNQPHTAGLNVAIGEIVTYTVYVTVPEGTMPNAIVVDTPDAGLAIVNVLNVVPSSGFVSTNVPGGFPAIVANANASIPVSGSSVTINMGTLTNSNTNNAVPETVIITYRAVVLNVIGNSRGFPLDNTATLTWSLGMLSDTGDTITIVEPTLDIIKTNGSPILADAGDVVTFTVTIQHDPASDADAFGVQLTDLIDSIPNKLNYVFGSVMVMNFGSAVQLGPPIEVGGDLTINWSAFPLGASAVITFDVVLDITVNPEELLTNTGCVTWTSLPGNVTTPQSSNPVSTERTGNPANPGGAANDYNGCDAGIILTPTFTSIKTVIDSSEPTTGFGQFDPAIVDLTIGETVTFAIVIDFIDGTTNNVVVTDNLPVPGVLFAPGALSYVSASLLHVGSHLTDGMFNPIVLPAPILTDTNGDGVIDQVQFNFGTIINVPVFPAPPVDEQMVIGIVAQVIDEYPAPPAPPNTQANVNGQTLTNTVTVTADSPGGPIVLTDSADVEIVEPQLAITKDAAPLVVVGGDTVTFTITVDHTMSSTADAFDVTITDIIPAGLTWAGNVTPILGPGPAISLALPTVTFYWTDIPLGAGPYQFTFDATVDFSIEPGDTFTNTADLEWSSLPGADPFERIYNDSDDAVINSGVTATNPAKSIVATSEASTAGTDVAIGEIVRYRTQAEFTAGTFPNVQFVDTLPVGMTLIDVSQVKISFSADNAWTLPGDLAGADNDAVPPTFVLPPARIMIAGQTVTFSLGTITNNDSDLNIEFVTIEYNVLVENILGNDNGDVLSNAFDLYVDGLQYGLTQSTSVTILEPSITNVDKYVVDLGSNTVTYQVTFSNTGTTTAFNTRLLDMLPAGVALNVLSIAVVLGAGASGLTNASAGNTVDLSIATMPVGGSATIQYTVSIVTPGVTLTNTANVTYTSLPGPNGTPVNPTGSQTPGASGAADGERNGSGGVNDYFDSDPEVLGSLGDLVWLDINGNGMVDFGEPGIPNVTVILVWPGVNGIFGDGDDVTVNTLTDALGNYTFSGLPAGNYRVQVNTVTLPPGLVNSYDLDGNLDSQVVVPLAAGQNRTDVDFGYTQPASVSGIKFRDNNGNGVRDPGEPTMAGVTIYVDLNNNGIFEPPGEPSAVTNGLGQYTISNLVPGAYTIREVPPAGFSQTFPPSNAGHNVVLVPGDNLTDLDFGNQPAMVWIIDDCGSAGFSFVQGVWFCLPICPGHFQNDVAYSPVGSPLSIAQWQFTGLTPGYYRVSATWHGEPTNATNSIYEVSGGVGLTSLFVNQQLQPGNYPNSFTANGATWMDLDPVYQILGNTLTVQVINNGADGNVVADAIRIEKLLSPMMQVSQGMTNIVDGVTQINYGTTATGIPVPLVYTVESTGGVNLLLAAPISVPAGYSVTSSFGSTNLPPNTSTNFTVQLDATSAGLFAGDISFFNNTSAQNPFNFPVTGLVNAFLIDNGDAGYSSVGAWTTFVGQGYENDLQFSAAGTGADVASWNFTGLMAGQTYQVYTTWTSHANRATNAPYTITGGAAPINLTVNQQNSPQGETVGGATWQEIGIVTLVGTTLTVQLTDNANGYVIADAVRIDLVTGPEISVSQGGTALVDGFSSVSYITTLVGVPQTKTYTVTNNGVTPLMLTNPPIVPGGFTATNFLSTNLLPGQSTTFTVTLDAVAAGSYSGFVALTNNDDDENPFLFTVSGDVFVTLPPLFMDNGDPGFSSLGTWTHSIGTGYLSDVHFSAMGTGTDVATWNFTVPAPGTYRVSATWTPHANRGTNAPFSVNGSPPVLLNQQFAPSDFIEFGTAWEDIGNFLIGGTSIIVTLTDSANGFVLADGIRLQKIASPEVEVDHNLVLLRDGIDTFAFGETLVGRPIVETFRVRNVGTETLIFTEAIFVPDGFVVSEPLPTGIAPEASNQFTITFNPQTAGSFGGEIIFVTNDPDEGFFSFFVSGTSSLGPLVHTIDNGDSGFVASGTWTHTTYLGQGHLGDVHYSAAGNGGDIATWTFNQLPAGDYRVLATWSPHANRATNAPYSINGGSPILVNQQVALDDLIDGGTAWEQLGTVTIVGNSLQVRLTDAANGFVIADAIRIELISYAEIEVWLADAIPLGGYGMVSFGVAELGQPRTQTFYVRNAGSEPLFLREPLETPPGFAASPPAH
jgi:fimbrial isopeptide formation D2 family protein/uncharacterized repeat protein (TIGR01451 family)